MKSLFSSLIAIHMQSEGWQKAMVVTAPSSSEDRESSPCSEVMFNESSQSVSPPSSPPCLTLPMEVQSSEEDDTNESK